MIIGAILHVAKIAKATKIFEPLFKKFACSKFATKNLSPNLVVMLKDIFDGNKRQMDNKELLHRFWQQDYPVLNKAEDYIGLTYKSEFLYDFLPELSSSSTILELGCNIGRNLNFLYKKGFSNLSGVEINKRAVKLMETTYPEFYQHVTIYNETIEDAIKKIPDNSIDLVFTMAVLEHIHPSSEFLFGEMVRISKKYILTIEDETGISHRHKARNYKQIFENLRAKEIKNSSEVPVDKSCVARLFQLI